MSLIEAGFHLHKLFSFLAVLSSLGKCSAVVFSLVVFSLVVIFGPLCVHVSPGYMLFVHFCMSASPRERERDRETDRQTDSLSLSHSLFNVGLGEVAVSKHSFPSFL